MGTRSIFYKGPSGNEKGPFTEKEILKWHSEGFFPNGTVFRSTNDVDVRKLLSERQRSCIPKDPMRLFSKQLHVCQQNRQSLLTAFDEIKDLDEQINDKISKLQLYNVALFDRMNKDKVPASVLDTPRPSRDSPLPSPISSVSSSSRPKFIYNTPPTSPHSSFQSSSQSDILQKSREKFKMEIKSTALSQNPAFEGVSDEDENEDPSKTTTKKPIVLSFNPSVPPPNPTVPPTLSVTSASTSRSTVPPPSTLPPPSEEPMTPLSPPVQSPYMPLHRSLIPLIKERSMYVHYNRDTHDEHVAVATMALERMNTGKNQILISCASLPTALALQVGITLFARKEGKLPVITVITQGVAFTNQPIIGDIIISIPSLLLICFHRLLKIGSAYIVCEANKMDLEEGKAQLGLLSVIPPRCFIFAVINEYTNANHVGWLLRRDMRNRPNLCLVASQENAVCDDVLPIMIPFTVVLNGPTDMAFILGFQISHPLDYVVLYASDPKRLLELLMHCSIQLGIDMNRLAVCFHPFDRPIPHRIVFVDVPTTATGYHERASSPFVMSVTLLNRANAVAESNSLIEMIRGLNCTPLFSLS